MLELFSNAKKTPNHQNKKTQHKLTPKTLLWTCRDRIPRTTKTISAI